jgi:hypothetical protein
VQGAGAAVAAVEAFACAAPFRAGFARLTAGTRDLTFCREMQCWCGGLRLALAPVVEMPLVRPVIGPVVVRMVVAVMGASMACVLMMWHWILLG